MRVEGIEPQVVSILVWPPIRREEFGAFESEAPLKRFDTRRDDVDLHFDFVAELPRPKHTLQVLDRKHALADDQYVALRRLVIERELRLEFQAVHATLVETCRKQRIGIEQHIDRVANPVDALQAHLDIGRIRILAK